MTTNVGTAVQLAVTVTLFAGIVNVVVALLALVNVTPPLLTVHPENVKPFRLPAWMVTVSPIR